MVKIQKEKTHGYHFLLLFLVLLASTDLEVLSRNIDPERVYYVVGKKPV